MRRSLLVLISVLNYIYSFTIISSQYFKSESCSIRFDNAIRSFSTENAVVSGYQFISKINNCKVTNTQKSVSWISSVVPYSENKLIYCEFGSKQLIQTDKVLESNIRLSEDSDLFKLNNVICGHKPEKTEKFVRVGDDIYTAIVEESRKGGTFRKYNVASGTSTKSYLIHTENIRNYLKVFSRGDFVYTVYLKEDGSAHISRVCKNDSNRSFYSYQYAALSCYVSQVSHELFLDVHYDQLSDRLYVLATRAPADLSVRLLCRYNVDDIDKVFNTGKYLYYDEEGNPAYMSGRQIPCSQLKSMIPYTELADEIASHDILVKKLEAYSSFDVMHVEGIILFYLSIDDSIDVYKLRIYEDSVKHIQRIMTGEKIQEVRNDGKQLYLVRIKSIDIILPLLCAHVKDPVKCYSDDNFYCAWSEHDWECQNDVTTYCDNCLKTERSFQKHFPNGIIRSVRNGCFTDISFYTASSYSTTSQVHRCILPPSLPNTKIVRQNDTCMGEVEFACKKGTTLMSGDLIRTCREDGMWTGTHPVCLEKRCSTLVVPRDSSLSSRDTMVGSVITVRCADQCHVPEFQTPLKCLPSGQWNSTRLPFCRHKTCEPLPTPANMIKLHSDIKCGTYVKYRCKDGYSLLYGNLKRNCLPDGTWDGSLPFCKITHCHKLKPPANGQLVQHTNKVGDVETITCNSCFEIEQPQQGFKISANAECLKTGAWSHSHVCKPITCPILAPKKGSSITYFNNSCIGRVEFDCAEGHELAHGTLVRHCQPNGQWSGSNPTCKRISCKEIIPPPFNNVEIVEFGGLYQDRAQFRCKAGTFLYNGSLELSCKGDGEWSNSVPVCQPANILFPELIEIQQTSTPSGPEDLMAIPPDRINNKLLLSIAIIGWAMFLATAVFIGFVFYVRYTKMHRGQQIDNDLDDKRSMSSKYNRQITTSTTTSRSSTLYK